MILQIQLRSGICTYNLFDETHASDCDPYLKLDILFVAEPEVNPSILEVEDDDDTIDARTSDGDIDPFGIMEDDLIMDDETAAFDNTNTKSDEVDDSDPFGTMEDDLIMDAETADNIDEAFLYSFDVETLAIEARLDAVDLDEDVAPMFATSAADEVNLVLNFDYYDTELDDLVADMDVDLGVLNHG